MVASSASHNAKYFAKKAAPGLYKHWASYEPTRGVITQTISPYQQHVMKELFHDIPHKIYHSLALNWYVPFSIAGFYGITYYLDQTYEAAHREHWP